MFDACVKAANKILNGNKDMEKNAKHIVWY
jgi:hypothetical protein